MQKAMRGHVILLKLENPSAALAFQVHAAIRGKDGSLIAPVLWSDNWIELTPGESRTLSALLPEDAGTPVVEVDGWNVTAQRITVSESAPQ